MMNLPDGLLDVLDEFSDARDEGLAARESCEALYDGCPSETISHIMKKVENVLQWIQIQVEKLYRE